jgi:hypothetical protein
MLGEPLLVLVDVRESLVEVHERSFGVLQRASRFAATILARPGRGHNPQEACGKTPIHAALLSPSRAFM